jgi:2-dehydropantoate 2-reductase
MDSWPRVAVIGPGAVGGFYGAKLAHAGAPVTVVGRPGRSSAHLDAIARNGIRIDSREFNIQAAVTIGTLETAIADADLVLFCVKTVDTESAAAQLLPYLQPSTLVISLQNGVDNVDRMREQGIDAIPAVVFVASAVEVPGEIKHRGRGDLVIGPSDGTSIQDDAIARVSNWFERAGVGCPVSEQIELELWKKLTMNSMANAVSALTGASYGLIGENEGAWQVVTDVATEATAVAHASGIPLDKETVLQMGLEICRTVGAATSSTQQDIARGRRTEIDALNGFLVRRGVEVGVPTPVNRTLWALVRLREQVDAC